MKKHDEYNGTNTPSLRNNTERNDAMFAELARPSKLDNCANNDDEDTPFRATNDPPEHK